MKLPKHEFRKLQQHWYQILADHGFKDIEKLEGDEFVLAQTASHCYRGTDEFERSIKEEYFRCLAQASQDEETCFRNDTDRYILIRHAEGAKIKTIMHELELQGDSRNRASVRFIIRKYEMAWGFRSYMPSQLNIKVVKK